MLTVGGDSDSGAAADSVYLGAAGAAGDGAARGRPPTTATPRDLANMLAQLIGGGTVLLAAWLEVEEAAMTPEEAQAVADPLARIVNRSRWGKQAAKRLLGSQDYIALSVALFSYGMRVYPLIRQKLEAPRGVAPVPPPLVRQPVGQQQPERKQQQPKQPAPADVGDDYDGTGVRFNGFAGWGAEAV